MAKFDDLVHLATIRALETAEILYNDNENARARQVTDHPFELPDNKFIKIFRLNKNMVDSLIERLDPYITLPNRISSAIDAETKVRPSYCT